MTSQARGNSNQPVPPKLGEGEPVRRSSQGEGGSTHANFRSAKAILSLEVLFERLPINLASLNKGHLLQH